MISIAQGEWEIVDQGKTVHCEGMTSCGLVLAFSTTGRVACYHWPFMSGHYLSTFDGILAHLRSEGGDIILVQVFANDFPNDASKAHCLATVHAIASLPGGAPTECYIHPGEVQGKDALVTLWPDGAQSLHPVGRIV
ncbi:hypothetical protein ACIQWR_37855 [Streptomyces sp. NPDC098789]|uniref:hypothetical protein n=1 Tax=Streptomyces sp. NPDC098789 TaxID=3366098 RepID=UPI0038290A69